MPAVTGPLEVVNDPALRSEWRTYLRYHARRYDVLLRVVRRRMLLGGNPIEPIRESSDNPGHFHEYTLGELRTAAERAGLAVEGWEAANYFGTTPGARAYAAVGRLLPPSLRHGITLWLRRV